MYLRQGRGKGGRFAEAPKYHLNQIEFTKENIDTYLKEVAKEYRKEIGKNMPAELILIGGAAVLVNYGFRDMTTDIDAVIQAASAMKDIINRVGERFNLPNGWLNEDFVKTASYSPKLNAFSQYYYVDKKKNAISDAMKISRQYLPIFSKSLL